MNPSSGKLVLQKQTKKLFCQHRGSNPRLPQLYLPARARTFLTGICISPTYLSCWISNACDEKPRVIHPESTIATASGHKSIKGSKVQKFNRSNWIFEQTGFKFLLFTARARSYKNILAYIYSTLKFKPSDWLIIDLWCQWAKQNAWIIA